MNKTQTFVIETKKSISEKELLGCLEDTISKNIVSVRKVKNKPDYKKGFDILMEQFDYLPEEDKPIIDKQLKRCGL